jgi:tRNA pseudouridine55 synthase
VSARRGATDLSGILVIDKPAGMTSHDVVNRVRRITGERRVGHAGTLDPMATGVLVALVGPATRLAPYLTSAQKTYEAHIVFGAETDTDDADGRVTVRSPVPDEVGDPFFAAATVASLVGAHQQVPPAYSAIKRDGVTAYQAARTGSALELDARTVEVADARLTGVECAGKHAWDVAFAVSKGT